MSIPTVVTFPRHRFNPFASYPRAELGEIENNLTRALFIGIREIAQRGRLGPLVEALADASVGLAEAAGKRLIRIRDAFKQAPLVSLTLLNAPSDPAIAPSKVLLLGVCGGDSRVDVDRWTLGTREGLTSIPDGAIVAGDAMLVFESKLPGGALDALQVAKHLERLGLLSPEERLALQAETSAGSAARWKESLADRVVELRWTAAIGLLKRHRVPGESPTLDAVIEYLEDSIRPAGTQEGLRDRVRRARDAVVGLLGATEGDALNPSMDLLQAFHAPDRNANVTDKAMVAMFRGEKPCRFLEHASIWRHELEQATEAVRPHLDAVAKDLESRLARRNTGWQFVEGLRGEDDVQGGYDPIDLHARWKPGWAVRTSPKGSVSFSTNGSLVLGADLFGTPWGIPVEPGADDSIYCTWHEQSEFVNWPTESAEATPDPAAIGESFHEVVDRVGWWARMWSARLDALPSDLECRPRVSALTFRGRNLRWYGSKSGEFVWPRLTYGQYNEAGGVLSLSKARCLLEDMADGNARSDAFFFPTEEDVRLNPDEDWRHRVRKPVISLTVVTAGGDAVTAAEAFAGWIESWPRALQSPDDFRKATRRAARK